MDTQKAAKLVGWLFIATFVTSITARLLFVDGVGSTWQDLSFVAGAGSGTSIKIGAIFESLLILANIGTAVVLYPIVKRQSERLALGYVTARVVESTFILVGLVSIISVVTLQDGLVGASGASAASMTATGESLVSIYEWAFLFGPGLVVGFGNGLMLGYLMYRSGLVPRRMAMLGLIGGPMLIVSFVGILFGVWDNGSGPAALLTLPEIAWEGSLGIYLAWRGFKPAPIITTVAIREPSPEPSIAALA